MLSLSPESRAYAGQNPFQNKTGEKNP